MVLISWDLYDSFVNTWHDREMSNISKETKSKLDENKFSMKS